MMPPIWRGRSIGVLLSAFVLLARVPARAEHPINEQDLKDGLPCHLLLQVAPSGIVQVAQVVQSVDSTSFDEMCLNSMIARHLTPHGPDGTSLHRSGWCDLKVNVIMLLPHKEAKALQDRVPRPVPALRKENALDLERFVAARSWGDL